MSLSEQAAGWPWYAAVVLGCALVGFLVHPIANRLLYVPRTARLGLRGVLPRHAAALAGVHATVIAEEISAQELLARIEPLRLARELDGSLPRIVDELAADVAARHSPGLWELLPGRLKRMVLEMIKREAPRMVADVVEEITVDAADVLDLHHLVHTALVRPARLGRLTRRIAGPTLAVAQRWGALAGALVGALAVLALAATASLFVLPAAGLLAAVAGRWAGTALALRTDFPRRRAEVAARYATALGTELITVDAIIAELTAGPGAAQVRDTVSREVFRTVDDRLNLAKPVVVAAIGARQFQRIKADAAESVCAVLPEALRPARGYLAEALDVRNTVAHRVRGLSADRYGALLRTVLRAERAGSWPVCGLFGLVVGVLAAVLYGTFGAGGPP